MEQILKAARSTRGPTPPCPARGVEDTQVSHPFPDVQCGHLGPFTELPSASVRFALGFGGGGVFRGQRGWGRWILPNQGFSFRSCCLHAILFSTVRLFSTKMCAVAWNKLCPSAWRRGSSTTQRAWSLLMAKTCGERRVPAATLAGAGKRKVRQGQRRDSSGRRLLLLRYVGLIAKQRKTELAKLFI